MDAEHDIHLRVVEHALLDHHLSAALFTRGRTFLGGLEDEHHGAGEVLAHGGEVFGGAHQHRHVRIVPAGVHDADLLVEVSGGDLGGERQVDALDHRQGVHIGAQADDGPGFTAPQDADDARMRDPGLDLQTEPREVIGDELGGAGLAVGEFGVLVDVAAPRDDFFFELGRDGGLGLRQNGEREGGGEEGERYTRLHAGKVRAWTTNRLKEEVKALRQNRGPGKACGDIVESF